MVDKSQVASDTNNNGTITTTIDGQDMTCIPTKAAAAAPAEAAAPIVSAAGSEETAPVNLNNIAPAAGKPEDSCDVPGLKAASADSIAHAVHVAKPDAGQTKTYAALENGQTYSFDFNYKDGLVETEGKNIVIRFADGSTIILQDFAPKAAHTHLIVDNCESAPMQFASLNNIAPAAGGNAAAAARSVGNTGAGFGEFHGSTPPDLRGPLGPLGPTALNYSQIGGLKPEYYTNTPDGKPNGLVNISTPINLVDETGGGGAGGDFSTPRTTGGNVIIDYGPDGPGEVRIIDVPTGLVHHGDPVTVTVSADGHTATGTAPDGSVIFVYTIDPTTSTYTFTQYGSLDHPVAGDPNESLDLPFIVRVTDSDGDYADSTTIMRVYDDAPSATVTAGSEGLVDETNGGSLVASGHVTFSYGGDGAGNIKLVDGPHGLTSHGTPVDLTVTDGQITGTAGGVTVFTLTLNTATGAWEYTQFETLDHPVAGDPNDMMDLGFTVRITDYDGDPVDTPITVRVMDDGPSIDGQNVTASLDETSGFAGVVTGALPVNYGQDGAAATDALRITTTPTGLMSHGVPVVVTVSADGLMATGTANGTTVFTLVLNSTTGEYTFTQSAPLDHPVAGDPNDALNLGFGFSVTDFDGDSANGSLTVTVLDDGPSAGSASFDAGDLGTTLTGTLPHGYGADGAGSLHLTGSLTGLTSGGLPVTVTSDGTTMVGKLGDGTVVFTLSANDSGYSFTQNLDLDGNPTLNVGYAVTDFDGDIANGTITINTRVDGLPTASATENTVDETGGFDTVSGTLPFSYGPDGASATDPVHITTTPAGLTSHGVPVVWTVSADGLTATGMAGSMTVATLVISNPATGAYTFTQSAALDHPDAGNPNDTLNLGFGFTVKDADGDPASGSLTIHVLDDGPSAGSASFTAGVLGTTLTGTLPHGYGADGAGSLHLTGSLTGLTSGGLPVTVTSDGTTMVGKLGDGTVVFTLSANDSGYSFTQNLQLDGNPTLNVGYSVADYDGDTANGTITITTHENGHPTACATATTVDETGGFDTVSGTLPFSYGPDGASATDPLRITTTPTGLMSHGVPVVVTVSADGLTATGTAGGTSVFMLTVNSATGGYTFAQTAALDHPNGSNPNDALNLGFGFTVKDASGDPATGSLTVTVLDDGPSITSGSKTVDETSAHDTVGATNDGIWATATSGTPITATGTVTFSYGQDGAGSLSLLSGPSGLTHHGSAVGVTIAGNQAVGTLGDGTLVFSLTLNADGTYTYKQYASLDHADARNPDDVLSMGFKVGVTDFDGDTAQANLTIKVKDDGPCAGSDSFCIDQCKLVDDCNPNTPLVTNTGHLNFSYGEDGKGSLQLTSTPGGLYSNGHAILVSMSGDTITGKLSSGQTIFTLQVNGDGTYTYKQYGEIDTGKCADTELKFGYKVVDADGDTACGNLNICVKGDVVSHQPPHIAVTVDTQVGTHTETVSLEHQFADTRVWHTAPERVAADPALVGISSAGLTIGGNYVLPAGVTDTPMHHVSITFEGETAGYSNSLGWFIVGPGGEIQDVKMAVANSDAFANGGTVSIGDVPAGSEIEFFIIPNGAQLNNYAGLTAGGTFEFWAGGAPGTTGAHLATTSDAGADIKLYYIAGGVATEIQSAAGQIYFASHETMNADGVDHIAAGMDASGSGELWLGFEDLKNGGDHDYNDLLFKVDVCPATATIETKSYCTDLSALVSDPDSTQLSHATVTLNGVAGDTMDLGNGYTLSGGNVLHNGVDTGVDFTRTSDGGFTLSGNASLNTYQGILDSTELHSTTNPDGLRTASFQVTDETGLNSNVATVSLYPDSGNCGCGEEDPLVHCVKDPHTGCGDVYVYQGYKGCETIHDFNKHEGDCVDIKKVLEGNCTSHEDLTNFVKVDCHDGNTVIKVDDSGSGCHFKDVAVLVGVTGCSVDSMIADGSLEVGRFHG